MVSGVVTSKEKKKKETNKKHVCAREIKRDKDEKRERSGGKGKEKRKRDYFRSIIKMSGTLIILFLKRVAIISYFHLSLILSLFLFTFSACTIRLC